jgi:hypothetical protein
MKKLKQLFKTIAPAQVDVIDQSIDEQIYTDVYSAMNLLLQEANKLLSQDQEYSQEDIDRLTALRHLGFQNAEEVKEFEQVYQKRLHAQQLKEKIEYYSHAYPMNRFIDKRSIEKVCNKYNLLFVQASAYLAEIPLENQKAIINFRLKVEDYFDPDWGSSFLFQVRNPMKEGEYYDETTQTVKKFEPGTTIPAKRLWIIAPEHKLTTIGYSREGHKLIKDPIVLQPVMGGYLIVTSWGLEASDPLVLNAKHN